MGIFCCKPISHHEQQPWPQNEREALLNSANMDSSNACVHEEHPSPPNSASSMNPIDLQNSIDQQDKIDHKDVCNNGAGPTKRFSSQSSTAIGTDSENEEYDPKILQLKSDQEQICAVQRTYVISELKTPSILRRTGDHHSNSETQDNANAQFVVESEWNLQKLAGEVQDIIVTSELKLATDANGIVNVEDQWVGSNVCKTVSCNTSEKPEEEKCAHVVEVEHKSIQNAESNTVVDAVSQECTSDLLTEPAVGTYSSDMKNSVNAAKRAKLSQGSDWSVRGEDLYRDEDEIEKEKCQRLASESQLADAAATDRSTIEPGVAILKYCTREWKGNTAKAQLMKKAYKAVSSTFSSVRRVRGDNYCALRATLFQVLSNVELLPCLQQDDLIQLPDKLIATDYIWIKQWYFRAQDAGSENPAKKLKEYLTVLQQKWTQICEVDSLGERQAVCEEVFKNDQEEYRLYEAMKILMLAKAIELDRDKVQEKEIPLFCWLLFARDTSTDPYQFMQNHLNHVGYTGGLDQVEMFLLGYSLELTIRVFRLYQFGTDEFVTFYPDDHKEDWPMVTLITEDDRHYNVPVENAQVTNI
ncbi:ubiquitin thioesterase otulin-like isoform X5 [Scyliorhinus torazame]|uniref:ubiquitin thioesterase otulin-like isoform X5 n=1 Tax=Scyliorhinus torazame TaxID=75743 RepID=UPI003B59B0AC